MLTALLLRANRVVPADRLIGRLWGDRPPPAVRTTLHSLVYRLRRRLEPRGTAGRQRVLTTVAPGYQLTVPPDRLDLRRFEDLAADGRIARASGRADLAAELFGRALALWRGQLPDDLAADGFDRQDLLWLRERHLEVVEAWLETELMAGRHAEHVGELRTLVEAYPLRERLSGQLMVALYRAGRQAEALASYATLRDVLVRDLGVEPDPELQRLHQAILTHDTALRGDLAGSARL